jgi:hypothetical protein
MDDHYMLLHDMADRPLPTMPVPRPGGVAFARDMTAGALLTSSAARELGARLILAADDHDAIVDAELNRREGG